MFRLTKVIPFCIKVDPAESGDSTTRVGAYKILRGHKASVASVAAQKYGSKFDVFPCAWLVCCK